MMINRYIKSPLSSIVFMKVSKIYADTIVTFCFVFREIYKDI